MYKPTLNPLMLPKVEKIVTKLELIDITYLYSNKLMSTFVFESQRNIFMRNLCKVSNVITTNN